MEERIHKIEEELERIKTRNNSVENDKAWEVSSARLVFIALATYVVVVIFFLLNHLPKPFLNPLVPVIGYILSTQTLPIIKRIWVERYRK